MRTLAWRRAEDARLRRGNERHITQETVATGEDGGNLDEFMRQYETGAMAVEYERRQIEAGAMLVRMTEELPLRTVGG